MGAARDPLEDRVVARLEGIFQHLLYAALHCFGVKCDTARIIVRAIDRLLHFFFCLSVCHGANTDDIFSPRFSPLVLPCHPP